MIKALQYSVRYHQPLMIIASSSTCAMPCKLNQSHMYWNVTHVIRNLIMELETGAYGSIQLSRRLLQQFNKVSAPYFIQLCLADLGQMTGNYSIDICPLICLLTPFANISDFPKTVFDRWWAEVWGVATIPKRFWHESPWLFRWLLCNRGLQGWPYQIGHNPQMMSFGVYFLLRVSLVTVISSQDVPLSIWGHQSIATLVVCPHYYLSQLEKQPPRKFCAQNGNNPHEN